LEISAYYLHIILGDIIVITSDYTKEQLIKLAESFLDEKDEEKENKLYFELNSHFSHPDVANLFFWPENYNKRKNPPNISEYNPSIEEIIQIGINHQPIVL